MRITNHWPVGVAATASFLLSIAAPEPAGAIGFDDHRVTFTSFYETTPTLGNDGTNDLVVYTSRELLGSGFFDQGDIYYQVLAAGQPSGPPVQVSAATTDDQLNDVQGDHIVYTAYDDTTTTSGSITLYTISTGLLRTLGSANIIQEPKVHGRYAVWREGGLTSTEVMIIDLDDPSGTPEHLTGRVPPIYNVEIGERYVVWAERDGDFDIGAFDLETGIRHQFTDTDLTDERQPMTSGPWIVWQAIDSASPLGRIEAYHPDSSTLRVVVDDGARNQLPSIDGDRIAYEGNPMGNFDVFVYRLSTQDVFQVTLDPDDQYLNDARGDLVAYVDLRSGDEDIYVTTLPDQATRQRAADAGRYSVTGFHNPSDTDYQAVVGGSRSFFVFDLGSLSPRQPILSATLQLDAGTVSQGGFGGISFALREVSTPIAALAAGGSGLTGIYDDLGVGTPYSGVVAIPPEADGHVTSIPLLPAGVDALEAARGELFAIGGTPTGLGGNAAFGGTSQGGVQLVIGFGAIPVPALSPGALGALVALLLALGLGGLRWLPTGSR